MNGSQKMSLFLCLSLGMLILLSCSVNKDLPSTGVDSGTDYYCHNGAYQAEDGDVYIISPSDEPNLRYRMPDGTTGKLFPEGEDTYISGEGWASKEDPFLEMTLGACDDAVITIRKEGIPQTASRMEFPVEKVYFDNDGTALYGELVLPVSNQPKAIVVLQYGSGRSSAVLNNYVQYLLPQSDIGVFVFDKRGTGNSEGDFTADFITMAGDLSAAVNSTKEVLQDKSIPIGVMGESQGGWVAPLTAVNTDVDFVISSYGLAVSPAEENRLEVMQDLEKFDYDDEILDSIEEVIAATDLIFDSNFEEGLEDLAELKAQHGHKDWYKQLDGDYTGLFAQASDEELKEYEKIFNYPIDLFYDPMPVLSKVNVPMLWVLAERDTEAPFQDTFDRIQNLQKGGSPTDIVVFPQAEHGIIAVEDTEEGVQLLGRYAPGYFEVLKDWILDKSITNSYGNATIHRSRH